ncbi:MAG: hypothetical protein MUO97_00990, partial [Dehalococcoidia bacterium]|nr:hypothetical protein [Dehalococcoidia bacterium]
MPLKIKKKDSKSGQNRGHRWWTSWRLAIVILGFILTLLGFGVQFLVTPIVGGMRSEPPTIVTQLTMSDEDLPPAKLIYTVDEEGELHTEYSPSGLYTLSTEEKLAFKNPMFPFPCTSITCHPTYKGSKLVKIYDEYNLVADAEGQEAVTVRPTTFLFPHESKVTILWERYNCKAEGVELTQDQIDDTIRVVVTNSNEYPVLYIAMIDLLPLKANTPYQVEIEDSRMTLSAPYLIKIETVDGTGGLFNGVQLPVEI